MIAIVDVCSGNLRSVERALVQAGGAVVVTRDPDVVRRADKIVVPGQGAFGVFMRGLGERGLGEALREAIGSGRPYLGICLGLQILFDASEEGDPRRAEAPSRAAPLGDLGEQMPPVGGPVKNRLGASIDAPPGGPADVQAVTTTRCSGLGIVRGSVVRLAPADPRLKVPHIGWNRLAQRRADPMLNGIGDDAYVYFVHSYHAVPSDPTLIAVETQHGIMITAAIRRDNIFACQFHPEKSQAIGLHMLRNFVEAA